MLLLTLNLHIPMDNKSSIKPIKNMFSYRFLKIRCSTITPMI